METRQTYRNGQFRPSSKEVAMLVKFSTLANGVFVEVTGADEYQPSNRCFRFDANGNAEFAYYGDLTSRNPAPRWYGHCFKEKEFMFA
jgi:hypothetical protein